MEEQKVCPGCGGPLEFDPEHGKLYCPHCGETGGEIPAGETEVRSEDFLVKLRELEAGAEQTEQLMVSCNGCGAEITLEPNVVADRCPYCGTPIVAKSHSKSRIRPSSLLPFRLTREEAVTSYLKWISSLWFLPGNVKKEAKMTSPSGVYLPHWCYDTVAVTSYTGARGEYYYVPVSYTETVNGKTVRKTRMERRTRWYPAAGTVQNDFSDLLTPATRSLPEELIEELTPWDLPELQPYDADYIRGFREESYSISLADGFAATEKLMKPAITETVEGDIGGDTQMITSMRISYHDIKFQHLLLPVWVGSFSHNKQVYPVTINARTGEVQGKRPYSALKITALVLFVIAVVLTAIYFVMQQ